MTDPKELLELTPMTLLVLGINLAMMFAKRMPFIPNWSLPILSCLTGAIALPLFTDPGKVIFTVRCPVCLQAFQGAVLGLAATGTHQIFRQLMCRFGWKDDPECPPQTPIPVPVVPPPDKPAT